MTGIMILAICNIEQVSDVAGWACLRLWVIVYSVGEAAQGPVQLQTLRGTLGHYTVIGGQFEDFGIPYCDELDSGTM
jgi:hypothetical protein